MAPRSHTSRPPTALAAEVRRELVGLLSARGMSTRAIAPSVGVSDMTVRRVSIPTTGTTRGRNLTPSESTTNESALCERTLTPAWDGALEGVSGF